MELPEPEQSEFNSSVATIYRLDSIQKSIAMSIRSKNYEDWIDLLIIYWKELRPVMKDTNRDKSRLDDLYKMASYCQKLYLYCRNTRKKYPGFVIEFFHDWEFTLRDLQQAVGLGVTRKPDPRHAMAR